MKPQIYIAVEDGLHCKLYNEFEHLGGESNPTLDLTEFVKVGERFEGEEQPQIRFWNPFHSIFYNWENCTKEYAESINDSTTETRIAIQPIQSKPLREDKEQSPTVEEMVNHTMGRMPALDGLAPTEDIGKVETVEQAAERIIKKYTPMREYPSYYDDGQIAFMLEDMANWQKEQMQKDMDCLLAENKELWEEISRFKGE